MTEQERYCSRFGMISIENEFLVAEQLQQALLEQVDDNLANRPHRVLGAICFDHGWMTPAQIEVVLNIMFKKHKSVPGADAN